MATTKKPKITKSQAIEELWYRGDLSWKYHAGQRVIQKAYDQITNKFFLLNCSRRFGKTYWLTIKALECLFNSPNPLPRIKYTSATYEDLKEFIIPSFELILADCPKEIRPIYQKSDRKFVNPLNGGEIKLVGIDRNPDGGRGSYCDLYIIDEARNINSDNLKYLYSSVIYPMTLNREGAKIIFASTPPDSADHAYVDYFMPKAKEEQGYVELNIFDAAHLSKKDREDAKKECINDEDYQREYLCQVITNPIRAIIQKKHLDGLVIEEAERPDYFNYLHRYVCMDLGVKNDLTAVGFGYWDSKTEKFYLEDEADMKGPDMTTNTLKAMINTKEKKLWGELNVYRRISDNNNPLLLQDLGILHNMHFMATSKDSLHAMVNVLREFIWKGKLVVNPRCEKTIGALKYGLWNKKRTEFDHSKAYGHYDHLAMLMYLVRNIDTDQDPVPWNHDKKIKYDVLHPNKIKALGKPNNIDVLVSIMNRNNNKKR